MLKNIIVCHLTINNTNYMKNLILIIIILNSFLFSCNENKIDCSDEEFCSFVSNNEYDKTGNLIDTFCATLVTENEEDNIEKLKEWLECKSCIKNVKIECNSCIFTNPPQSELSVVFRLNGDFVTKTLDILMSKPMKFRAYHE